MADRATEPLGRREVCVECSPGGPQGRRKSDEYGRSLGLLDTPEIRGLSGLGWENGGRGDELREQLYAHEGVGWVDIGEGG